MTMPWLGQLQPPPYHQSNIGAAEMLGKALASIAQGKRRAGQQQFMEAMADVAAQGGDVRSNLMRAISTYGEDRPSGFGGFMDAMNPFAPARGLPRAGQSMLSSLIGQSLKPEQSQYGQAPWTVDPQYAQTPQAQVAAGMKPRAAAIRPVLTGMTPGQRDQALVRSLNADITRLDAKATRLEKIYVEAQEKVSEQWSLKEEARDLVRVTEIRDAAKRALDDTRGKRDAAIKRRRELLGRQPTSRPTTKASTRPAANEGRIAVGPNGERVIVRNGRWVPLQ